MKRCHVVMNSRDPPPPHPPHPSPHPPPSTPLPVVCLFLLLLLLLLFDIHLEQCAPYVTSVIRSCRTKTTFASETNFGVNTYTVPKTKIESTFLKVDNYSLVDFHATAPCGRRVPRNPCLKVGNYFLVDFHATNSCLRRNPSNPFLKVGNNSRKFLCHKSPLAKKS